jgi:hypothetical protein
VHVSPIALLTLAIRGSGYSTGAGRLQPIRQEQDANITHFTAQTRPGSIGTPAAFGHS